MSVEEVLALPASVNLTVAAQALGIGKTTAYQLAKQGDFPLPVTKYGRTYRVTRAALLRVLEIPDTRTNGHRPGT